MASTPDPAAGHFRRYLSDPGSPHGLKARPVLAIEEGPKNQLWIGTWAGGLHRFDPATGRFHHYPVRSGDPSTINSNFVWNIVAATDGTVWIGTEDAGLYRYRPETESFTHYADRVSHEYVPGLLQDREGKIWIGTFGGLDVYDPATDSFRHIPHGTGKPNATSSKNVRTLYQDSRGWIWVGTEQLGVDVYKPEMNTFSNIGTSNGLPSANISSIVEDVHGDMWLTTTNGLAKVSPKTFNVTVFRREDGIAGSNFNRNASLSDHHGNLYFGSTEGITVFHPDDLHRINAEFPVYISQFRLFNRKVAIGSDSPLKAAITLADSIILPYTDTMFSFDMVALNYRQSASMRYSYKLEGFDRDWNNIGQNNTAVYTNINPGNYTFRTRASPDGEHWVEGQSLTITLLPPPWRTWWAYAVYALMIAVLLYFARKYIILRIRAEAYRSRSLSDPLTGLHNRAGTAQVVKGIFSNTETKQGACLMIMDIDHFKDINDHRGHDAGDRILCAVARTARECLRSSDHVGRWGGEEFVLLCATNSKETGFALAEKVRTVVADQLYEQQSQSPVRATVSVGLTQIHADDTFESALKRADTALYRAKAEGRNRVVCDW